MFSDKSCARTLHLDSFMLFAGMFLGLTGCSAGTSGGDACPPDLTQYVGLEVRAKPGDPLGITAQSTLQYLAREKLPTTGFYLSRKPLTSNSQKVEYQLIHESGFDKPCSMGNKSGFDGVLEIDPATREVRQLILRSDTP